MIDTQPVVLRVLITLLFYYTSSQIFLATDLLYAFLRRNYSLRNGMKQLDEDGKEKLVILQWWNYIMSRLTSYHSMKKYIQEMFYQFCALTCYQCMHTSTEILESPVIGLLLSSSQEEIELDGDVIVSIVNNCNPQRCKHGRGC